eukprot:2823622-Amphidinium_carterae.1
MGDLKGRWIAHSVWKVWQPSPPVKVWQPSPIQKERATALMGTACTTAHGPPDSIEVLPWPCQ